MTDKLLNVSTTLPYIHCPNCGMIIAGVVKSDTSPERVLEKEIKKIFQKLDNLNCETCKDWHTIKCPIWISSRPKACILHSKIAELRQQEAQR